MKRMILLMCAIVLTMVGCTKGVYEEPYSDYPSSNLESQEFYASLEGSEDSETKTYLDENVKLLWHADDRISLFRSTLNEQFRFKGETGDNAGTFALVPSDEWGTGNEISTNYGVYPYSENTKLTNEEEIQLSMPAVQMYAPNSFGLGANTMVAATESASSTFLPFRNLCGFLMLKLYSENATIANIELTGNNNEVLAGPAVALAKYGKYPLLTMNEGGATSLTLNCGEGVKLSTSKEEPTQFWIVVPPVLFAQGFTITITDALGNVTTKSTSKSQTIVRNGVKSMTAFEIENSKNYAPSRTITYTTTDDALVEISKPSGFGSEIVSHIYENGMGTIRTKEPIVNLDSVFANKTTLSNVTLPEGLKTIGHYAFDGCTNLQNVTIPESVTAIANLAFGRCTSFTSVSLHGGIAIDPAANGIWEGCSSLVEFNSPNATADKRCLLSADGKTLLSFAPKGISAYSIPEGVTTIARGAIISSELNELTLPQSVTTFNSYALFMCESITSLTLPANVSKIGGMGIALQNLETLVCEGSTPATVPNNSFVSSSALKYIIVPKGSVDTYKAATGWSDYAEVIVDRMPQANNEIWYTSTNGTKIELSNPSGFNSEIILHTYEDGMGVIRTKEPITDINSVFANNTYLYNVTLPEGLKTIGRYAFDGCENLQNITIPQSVTTIGYQAFSRCRSFTSVTLHEGITSITSNPWGGCSSLAEFNAPKTTLDKRGLLSGDGKTLISLASVGLQENYVIPEGIIRIGNGAITHKNSLASITLPQTLEAIDSYGLYDVPGITTLNLPVNVTSIAEMGLSLRNLETLVCEGSTPAIVPNNKFVSSSALKYIIVPKGSVDTYKAATGWSDYAEIIVDRMPQANNEIWYTATAKVEPYDKTVFGANYVSNEWNSETGEGVITFDSEVTSIGKNAFNSRRGLTSVTLPNSVTTIGQYAFEYCPNLTTMNIPESVTSINGNAFRDCANLSAFTGKFATADGCALIVNNAFCAYAPASTKYTSYTIPSGVTSIGESAFYGCKNLINITIPQDVTSIGMCAFYDCNSLKSLVVPSGVKSIEKSTFYGCTCLASVTIPEGVTSIGVAAFTDCTSLTNINIPASVTTIRGEAFYCSGLTNIVIPEGVETIGNATFYNCSNLESATIPQSVTLIGRSAFKECSKLTSVYCKPTEVPSGADGMFYGNAEERKIYVPQESVDAYKGADEWKNYADAIIPYDFEKGEVVKVQPNNEIWYTATEKVGDIFYGFGANCVSNKWDSETGEGVITFDGDVIKIAYEAFHHCSGYHTLRSIAIPNSVASIEESAFSSCHTLTSVIIGNSVKSIGENAFYGCEKLGSIIIPNSVTAIEDYAFSECRSLTSVTIGNNVKSIGESAFSGCNSLPSIVIPGNVTSIGFQSFEHCSKLTSVILNNGVAKIDAYAFQCCHGLTSITIPESVTSIGYSAFYKCENLTSIYCKAITPPAAIAVYNSWDAFAFSALSRKFYVPTESVEAYKTAQYWKGYANDIVGYDF